MKVSAQLYSVLRAIIFIVIALAAIGGGLYFYQTAHAADGDLQVSIIAGYNLVVDSNVKSPSTAGPSVATVIGKFCNTSSSDLPNVTASIGNFVNGSPASDTPGVYPARTITNAIYNWQDISTSYDYSFAHLGGASDASRFVGDIPAGQCKMQYWSFSYPRCENNETPPCSLDAVWGDTRNPNDDLWLEFDVWGKSVNDAGAEVDVDDATWRMTMRNEISAMANKIEPHPNGHWFNTDTSVVEAGEVITSNGVYYTFGNVNKGFDNDNDLQFDYNAWMQPFGDASYDPSCFRLIRTTGVVTVTRASEPDLILNFRDNLYFTNLPNNNTNVTGIVHYTFLALGGTCMTSMTPYQEAASGADNEKFNADYGAGIPPVQSKIPQVVVDKNGNTTQSQGGTISYSIPFRNEGDTGVGLTLASGYGVEMPFTIQDTVPAGVQYKCGSAALTLTYDATPDYAVVYSADGGETWNATETGLWTECADADSATNPLSTADNPIILRWQLANPLPAKPNNGPNTSNGTATFEAIIPVNYLAATSDPLIENEACANLGGATLPLDCGETVTQVEGENSIGDFVWRDLDRDGVQDGGAESGIEGVTVWLYWDLGTSGSLDAADLLIRTTETDASGLYSFPDLIDGDFLVVVDEDDPQIPVGYPPTTATTVFVNDLGVGSATGVSVDTVDFGFGPILSFDKQLVSGDPSYEGTYVTYHIDVTNRRSGDGNPPGPCIYTVWGTSGTTGAGNKAWTNPTNAWMASEPNSTYATAPFANAGEELKVSGFTLATPSGSIQKVEIVLPFVSYPTLAGTLQVYASWNGTGIVAHTYDVATISSGLMAVDVTADRAWTWTDFNTGNLLGVLLETYKSGNPSGHLDLDAVGFRVTTNQTCGNPSDTINPLPLTDTFDATKLQFVSANPSPASVSGNTITWNNAGPVYAGQTKEILVQFLVLPPPDSDLPTDGEPDPTTHQNCAATTDGTFADGARVNDASDCVTHNINPAARIGDLVWVDANGNGSRELTEPGIPNVTVRLWDCGANGTCENGAGDDVLVAITTTDASGAYLFQGVRDINRNYEVIVDVTTLPNTTTWTNTYDCADAANNDSRCTGIPIDYDNNSATGDDYLDADFGYQPVVPVIVGAVWHDRDNSGDGFPPDAGEPGLPGVTVYLYFEIRQGSWGPCDYPPAGAAGNDCIVGTTDANGNFVLAFPNDLASTDYRNFDVRVVSTSGPLGTGTWTQTYDSDGTGTPHLVFLIATEPTGTTVYRADYSYRQTGSLQIGDLIFADWDGDAAQDSGEEGIQGVVVELYADDGDGVVESGVDYLVGTRTTDANGAYLFNNLPPGDYVVRVRKTTLPSGYYQTKDPGETGVCKACDNLSFLDNLAATNLNQDFAYQPRGLASIGDYVWRDTDRDGVQDASESGLPNITVNLYQDQDGDGVIDAEDALVATTYTDADGLYLFTNLNAGAYLVEVDTADPQLPTDGGGNRYVLSTDDASRSRS